MNRPKILLPLFVFALLSILSYGFIATTYTNPNVPEAPPNASIDAPMAFNMTAIANHIKFLSNISSRLTGYPGCDQAAEYIYNFFNENNLTSVLYHNYSLLVPVDYGAEIRVSSPVTRVIPAFPLWPNVVATGNTHSMTGNLIYVKEGSLSDFDGKRVEGSIALMDFGTTTKGWLRALNFGAKALIFIEPEFMLTQQASSKILDVPLNIPRLYVSREDGGYLRDLAMNGEVTVELESNVRFEVKTARNVLGFINGTTDKDQYIILSAHFDSFSFIPSLSPGADEACGIAALLELAKFYAQNPPKYSLLFIAFSGHDTGLYGSRQFVYDWMIKKYSEFGIKIMLVLNLDLSSHSDGVMPLTTGSFYGYEYLVSIKLTLAGLSDHMFNDALPLIEQWMNKSFEEKTSRYGFAGFGGGPNWGRLTDAAQIMTDHEPFTNIGAPALSFVTIHDWRTLFGTPMDTFEYVDFENLETQLELTLNWIYLITNTENLNDIVAPWKLFDEPPGHYGELRVTLAEYNYSINWYTPLPDTIFVVRDAGSFMDFYMRSHRLWIYALSDEKGDIFIPSLGSGPYGKVWDISAYKLNEAGDIVYAPDLGRYMYPTVYLILWLPTRSYDLGYFALFRCGSIVLFNIGDSTRLNFPVDLSLQLSVSSHETHAPLDHFSPPFIAGWTWGITPEALSVIFVPPEEDIEVIMRSSYAIRYPLACMINASKETPQGSGYITKAGQQFILRHSPLNYAEDLYWLNEMRLQLIKNEELNLMHQQVGSLLNDSKNAINQNNYSEAYTLYNTAWHLAREVYAKTRLGIDDEISSVVVLAATLGPFAFLLEGLIFAARGRKRILTLIICYALPVFILKFLHPAFNIASNIYMTLIGFIVLVLVLPLFFILGSHFNSMIGRIRRKALGVHEIEVARASMIVPAFSTGIQQLRRRKSRTIMTLISVVLVMAAMASFLSISLPSYISSLRITGEVPYTGVHIKYGVLFPLDEEMVEYLIATYGHDAVIAPRIWLYASRGSWNMPVGDIRLNLATENSSTYVVSIVGITPQEVDLTKPDKAIVSGRWFVPDEVFSCIISEDLAKKLGINSTPDYVSLAGLRLTVVGIINEDMFDNFVKDLDQLTITPIDIVHGVPGVEIHSSTKDVLLVTYELAGVLGGRPFTVSIKFKDSESSSKAALSIFERFSLPTYYTSNHSEVRLIKEGSRVEITNWQFYVTPLATVTLILLNTMLGAIYERVGDISIFSSIGMSPLHVSIMFLAEFLIYGLTGTVIGYFLAMFLCIVGSAYLKITLVWSSPLVVLAMAVGTGTIILASLFPLYKVSKITTPSLKRKWEITPPKGDTWEIVLPFTESKDELVDGILAYITEFALAHQPEGSVDFTLRDMRFEERVEPGYRALVMEMAMDPYEIGVSQHVKFTDMRTDGRHSFSLLIQRKTGSIDDWTRINRKFIDLFRKQLLLWRTVPPREQIAYISKFSDLAKQMKKE